MPKGTNKGGPPWDFVEIIIRFYLENPPYVRGGRGPFYDPKASKGSLQKVDYKDVNTVNFKDFKVMKYTRPWHRSSMIYQK